jgi:anti-anti-sigma factor
MHPHIIVRTAPDGLTVRVLVQKLDDHTAHAIKDRLMDIADNLGSKQLNLDFDAVESLGSTTLAMLVTIHRRLARANRHLVLTNLADHLMQLFQLTRLDTLLDLRGKQTDTNRTDRALA